MKPSIQTPQGLIEQPPTEGAPPHAKPFLAATAAQKASQASRLARWLPTPGNVIFTLLAIGLLIMTQSVWSAASPASTPGASATTVNYQGRLADSSGNPLSGSYNLQFAIYDASTGSHRVWGPENHLGISVTDGLFSVDLGSQTTGGIPTSTWDGERYLEITVNGEPLTPRELIRSVPIAGMALTVPDGAITTEKIADGAVTTAKLNTDNGLEINGDLTVAGNITGEYLCCGHTNTDGTGWVNYTNNGIYIDVDTSGCNFPATPMYFTSLGGDSNHFTAMGATSIYDQDATHFRVYLYKSGLDPAYADVRDWHIQWCGIKQKTSGLDTGSP